MVARPQVGPPWTVEQYLVLERYSTVKHEYHGGYVYALAGGSQAHSQIAGNVLTLLRTAVRGSGGRALNPDIKIVALSAPTPVANSRGVDVTSPSQRQSWLRRWLRRATQGSFTSASPARLAW
jgi:hypothetical protein